MSGLIPAIVSGIDEQSFIALTRDGSETVISWEHGLKGKRRYESVDRRSGSAQSASDLVAIGDMVRLRRRQAGDWHLSQLPDAQAALVSLDADNGGSLEFQPPLREAIATGQALDFTQPKSLWRMAANDVSWSTNEASLQGFSFAMVEAL